MNMFVSVLSTKPINDVRFKFLYFIFMHSYY